MNQSINKLKTEKQRFKLKYLIIIKTNMLKYLKKDNAHVKE